MKFIPDHNKFKKTLNGVPIWKLFIDKDFHSSGEMSFDHSTRFDKPEPGYNAAMHSAFRYMLENLNKKLDSHEFLKINRLCTSKVENLASAEIEILKKEAFFYPASYGLDRKEVSKQAEEEWSTEKLIFTSKEKTPIKDFLAVFAIDSVHSVYVKDSPTKTLESKFQVKISNRVDSIFNTYYEAIDKADTESLKLQAIVSLCRKLEIGHFFADGNQRTIVFVILNKLLMENSFPPVILEEPTIFDGFYSQAELVELVKEGMKYFSELQAHKSLALHQKNENENTFFKKDSTAQNSPQTDIKSSKNIKR